MTRSRSLLVIALLVAVLAAAGYAYWWRGGRDERAEYVTVTVDRGRIASTVTATGTVNPVTTVQVGTYVSGPIQAIYVDFNSPVKKGQLVAKIDPASFEVAVRQAEANVANARAKIAKDRADLTFKRLTLTRNRELRARNLIAQNDVDTAKNDSDQAVAQLAVDEAAVRQMQAALAAARINLAYTDIRSPVDGVVVSRNVDVGQTVAASFQTPTLFLIAQDLTKMQVDTNVSESDIGGVRPGQAVSFTVDAYPGEPFHGVVAQVRNAPITVQNVVTYDVVVAVDNAALRLKPGMTATASIVTAERDKALRVPLRALRFHPQRVARALTEAPAAPPAGAEPAAPRVWVLQPDGSVRAVDVQTGVRNDEYAEVVSGGLHAGDQVALAFRRGARESGTRLPGFAARRFH